MRDSPLIPRIVLYFVACIAISIPAGINYRDARELALIERTAQSTVGTIIAKQCANHGKVWFDYSVDGRHLKGSSTSCDLSCEDAAIGDSVTIVYSSERVGLARCSSLQPAQARVTAFSCVIAFFAFVLAIVIWEATRVSPPAHDDVVNEH